MPINRDYKAEYQRRVARALSNGLSRSQARGHAKANEAPLSSKARSPPDERLEYGLRKLRSTGSLSAAAKEAHVSAERLRRVIRELNLAKREGRKWVHSDSRIRLIEAVTTEGVLPLKVAGFEAASLVGKHDAAVKAFLDTQDISLLDPFRGVSVKDTAGRRHFFETNPNALYRLAASGSEVFEQIYKIIS